MKRFIVIFIAFVLAYGCVSTVGGDEYAQGYYEHIKDHKRIAVSDLSKLEECKVGSCWCFVCEEGLEIEAFKFSTNLAGGRCSWEKECTASKASELNFGTDEENMGRSIRQFMIGQGPTISDFAEAQPQCHHGLGMAVQWLIGDEDDDYDLPDASRAICLLSLDVMPVYVLYSGGENIDRDRAGEVAHVLATEGDDITMGTISDGPVGPVIIVTEMDFDISKSADVADQVDAINEECNDRANGEVNCFVAVAPKFNDYAALNTIMEEPGMKEGVDFIAYGINYRETTSCDPAAIRAEALAFSEYALYNHSKPTIIPYILFDSAGTSKEDDDGNTCEWDENKMIEAYASFWPSNIYPLQEVGVVGLAPYSYSSAQFGAANPLECNDCDLSKNQQRMQAWFGGCQDYAKLSRQDNFTKNPGSGIIFPNESAGNCDHNAQFAALMRETKYAQTGGGSDLLDPVQGEMEPPQPKLYSCSACVTYNLSSTEPSFAFTNKSGDPDGVMIKLPAPIELDNGTIITEMSVCEVYPEVDIWADRRNLDPMLVRAIIYGESNFNPCAAAKVCSKEHKQSGGTGCFQAGQTNIDDECYEKAYNEMHDPVETCNTNLTNAPNVDDDRPDWRWCGLGIMQSLEPPYTFWPSPPAEENGQYLHVYENSGFYTKGLITADDLEAVLACAPNDKFNPFNASHSLCIGTAKLANAMQRARQWLNSPSNHARLNWDEDNYEKDEVFAAYIAAHMYGGFWNMKAQNPDCTEGISNGDCWTSNFLDSWTVTKDWCEENKNEDDTYPYPECTDDGEPNEDECYGYTDFVEYMRNCEVEHLPRPTDPGNNKMSTYYWLRDGCEISFCPPGKEVLQEAYGDEWEDYIPDSGNIYIPDPEEEEEEEESEETS